MSHSIGILRPCLHTTAIIAVGFGDQLDNAEYLSFTIPDVHDLVHVLQHALDDPIPYLGAS